MVSKASKDKIDEWSRQAIPAFEAILSSMTGSRVRIAKNDAFLPIMNRLSQYIEEWTRSLNKEMSEHEKKKKISDLMNNILKITTGRDDIANPIEIFDRTAFPMFHDPTKGFMKKTDYDNYRKSIFVIVRKVITMNKRNEIIDAFDTATADELLAVTQGMVRINKVLPYLDKKHAKVTKQIVERYIAIYDLLAGYMEKMVLELYIFKKILEGKSAEYAKLRKSKLSDLVNSLRTVPEFDVLVKPLNLTIRNAIAHKGIVFDPIPRHVKFVDRRKTEVLKYEEVIVQTRELASAVFYVSHIDNAMKQEMWKLIKEYATNYPKQ